MKSKGSYEVTLTKVVPLLDNKTEINRKNIEKMGQVDM